MPRRRRLALVAWLVLLSACLGVALAQAPATGPLPLPDGSEVLISTSRGDRLLGYGRVEDRVLRLDLATDDRREVALVVVTPDGTFASFLGRIMVMGLEVEEAQGPVPFEAWLADRGVSLVASEIRRDDDDRDDGDDGDDRGDDGGDDRDDDGDDERDDDDAPDDADEADEAEEADDADDDASDGASDDDDEVDDEVDDDSADDD